MAMNLASPLENLEGHRPSHCKRNIYPLAWGIIFYLSSTSVQGEWPSGCRQGAISGSGGHGDGGCCWLLAIGCSVLTSGQILQ
jgi:hypothetical protein